MTTRIQPWTEPELMDRESVFEAQVEKALHRTMRQVASTAAGVVFTAAATLPVDPAVEGSYSALQTYVMAEWTAQVQETLYPFLTSTFIDSAARVVDGVQAASGIVVDQLTGTYADEVLQYAYNRMVGIGEALWLTIRDQLVEGYNAGESIDQIAERLATVAGLSTPRALTVARTEIISAANNGSYLQMLDAGFSESVTKVWLATEDTRTRLSHRHADDQGVELTGEFTVDIYSGDVKTGTEPMEFPGDPSATPGNIINCRCSLAFDFEDEAEEVLTAAKKFVEIDHPRDGDGKFKKKGAADKYVKIPDVADKPSNSAPVVDKVAWMAAHKWDSMSAGQKGVLIKNIDEPTWQKLPPELKEKILDAPGTTSHPEAKNLLEQDVAKLQGFQDEADDDADTDAAPAGGGARPVGGVDTKTGKPLVAGKPTKLRVQLLYNTTFADGAIMAVRKDSGERVVWDEKAKKIKRQKLSADGKYETTEALSRGAAYAAWKDEDGWTIPDATDAAPAAAATPAAQASAPAVGKPVKLKVQLIYQTPFDDGDIVAVNPTTGETIHWDAKKKRMVVTSELGTTDYTRGALYKQFKDEDGWHLPLDKKGAPIVPTPVPAKKAVPPAKSAKPKAAPAAAPTPDKTPKFTSADANGMMDVADNDQWPNGTVLWEDQQTLITKYNQDGDFEVTHVPTGKNEIIKSFKVDAGTLNSAVENVAIPDKPFSPVTSLGGENTDKLKDALGNENVKNGTVLFDQTAMGQHTVITKTADGKAEVVVDNGDPATVTVDDAWDTANWLKAIGTSKKSSKDKDAAAVAVSTYVASDDSNAIYEAWDNSPPGEIWSNGPFSVGLSKNGNLLFLDATPGGGVGVVKSADVNSENIDKALEAVMAGKSWTVDDGIPEVDPDEISAPGGSEDVSAGQSVVADSTVEDIKDNFDSALEDDLLFENDALTVEKYTDTSVIVKSKINPGYDATYSPEALTAEHLNDFIELNAPAAPTEYVDRWNVDQIKEKAADSALFPLSTLWQDGDISVIKGGNGSIGVTVKDKGFIALGPDAITPEKINQAIADALAGTQNFTPDPGTPATTAVSPDKAAQMKKWAQDSSTADGEEFHNGVDFKIFKASSGMIVIYKKDSNGDIDPTMGKVLFGDEITADNIQNALNELGAGNGPTVPVVSTPAVNPQAQSIVDAWSNAPGGTYTSLVNEPDLKVYRATSGRLVIKSGDEQAVGILSAKDVTPENVAKGIAAVQAGYDFSPGEEIPDVSLLSPAPGVPAPTVDTTPVGSLPDPASLKDTGQTVGTHGGKVYRDNQGNSWLFKAAPSGFKAAADVDLATAKIHAKAGLVTPDTGIVQLDGKYGSLQKMIPNASEPWGVKFDAKKLGASDTLAIQKEHIFDWLVGNHDAHAMNLLKDDKGNIIGIDKGQAFKYFGGDTLDPSFKPNEHVQAANSMFQQFIKSPLSVDLASKDQLNSFINKLQSIPDDEYKAMLRPYAVSAAKEGKLGVGGPAHLGIGKVPFPANDVEAFLSAAVARKNSLDQQITDFYKKLDDASLGKPVNWKLPPPAPVSPINPPTVSAPSQIPGVPAKQKPIKLSASVLTGKTSQGYFDGQVIAEHPSANERLVWNAKTKKYDVQVETSAGKWTTAYSYNKSAALANLKDDSGWMTPSTPQVANSGTSAGDPSLAPSINGAPQVHQLPMKTAPAAVAAPPKPKISVADLKAQADLSTVILPSATKAAIWSNFRTKGVGGSSTVTLSSEPKDIFEGLLIAQAMHNKANPNAKLSLLQVLRLADVVGTEKAMSSVNQNLYENKVIGWLQTPAGLKAAQSISDNVSVAGIGVSTFDNFNKTLEKFKEHHAKSLKPTAGWTAAMAALPPHQIKAHQPNSTYPELTVSQGNKFGADMIAKYGAIPASGKSALKDYTGSSYGAFNSYFRSFGKSSSHMATSALNASKGLRPSTQNLTVHRNSDTVFDSDWTPTLAQLQDFKGVVFTEDALASTSNDGHTFNGKAYRFIIEVPEGTPIAWVDEFSQHKGEAEFILGPGLKYEILEITGPGTGTGASTAHKKAVIRMRVVP